MPVLSASVISVAAVLIAIVTIVILKFLPPSKQEVLNTLFRKGHALTRREIILQFSPRHEKRIAKHLARLVEEGEVKHLGDSFQITLHAGARLEKQLEAMPPITLDNMP